MELDPSYILAVMKAASSSDVNTQSAASRLPAPPTLPRSTTPLDLAPGPQIGRRRRAGSDPTEYDDRRRQVKKLEPLLPKRPHPTQPLIPRLPYWEPPIFDYSLQYDLHDKAQKKFKEMANGNQDELTWKTNYLDNITEWELLQLHLTWAKQAREELHNLGGMEEERKFMQGLTHALREDRKDVVSDLARNNEAFGKTREEEKEVRDMLDVLMDERCERYLETLINRLLKNLNKG